MFMRDTRGSYDPSREAEARAFIEEEYIPALTALPGFRGYTLGLDESARRHISVTLWDTAEQANGLRQALGETILRRIADLGIHLDSSDLYEVAAHA
jgi:hypothetical protein